MFFGKQKFDVSQLKMNKFIFVVKQLKMKNFINSMVQLIISTSDPTLDVPSLRLQAIDITSYLDQKRKHMLLHPEACIN